MRVSRVKIHGAWTSLVGIALFLGVGLATSADLGEVSTSDLQAAFQKSILPAHWGLQSFRVLVSENIGTKVEPLVKSRFQATIILKIDTFKQVGTDNNVIFIEQVLRSGEKRDIHGTAAATFFRGQWKIEFTLESEHPADLGLPRAGFSRRTVINNSQEVTAYRAELQKKAEADLIRKKEALAALLAKYGNGSVLRGSFNNNKNDMLELTINSFDTTTQRGKAVFRRYSAPPSHSSCSVEGDISTTHLPNATGEYRFPAGSRLLLMFTKEDHYCFTTFGAYLDPQNSDTLTGETWNPFTLRGE